MKSLNNIIHSVVLLTPILLPLLAEAQSKGDDELICIAKERKKEELVQGLSRKELDSCYQVAVKQVEKELAEQKRIREQMAERENERVRREKERADDQQCQFAKDSISNKQLIDELLSSIGWEPNECRIYLPNDAKYVVLPQEKGEDVSQVIAVHPEGEIYFCKGNSVLALGSRLSITLPLNVVPTAACWTNKGDILCLFSNDTLYGLINQSELIPLAHISARQLKMSTFGDNDIAFCIRGGTAVYRLNPSNGIIDTILLSVDPIFDFVSDYDNIIYTDGCYLVGYTKEHKIIPILQHSSIIYTLGLCGESSLFVSDENALWQIDYVATEKARVVNTLITDIVSDNYNRTFLKFPDNTWIAITNSTKYESSKNQ